MFFSILLFVSCLLFVCRFINSFVNRATDSSVLCPSSVLSNVQSRVSDMVAQNLGYNRIIYDINHNRNTGRLSGLWNIILLFHNRCLCLFHAAAQPYDDKLCKISS